MEVQNMKDSDSEDDKKMSTLLAKIEQLESENKKIRDEFDVQRAKMKDFILQKEVEFSNEKTKFIEEIHKIKTDLDEARSQILIADLKLESDLEDEKRKAQEQIASLQQLINETVEESSSSRSLYDLELQKLQSYINQLETENKELKSMVHQSSPHHQSQEPTSLGPSVMLSAVTKSIVRKFGAESFTSQDNLEESMRKAQEDAEMLRSLVIPLEEEIKALKDKLRSTDEKLQRCLQCRHVPEYEIRNLSSSKQQEESSIKNASGETPVSPSTLCRSNQSPIEKSKEVTSPESPAPCDMCSNYEAQLVHEQQRNHELERRLATADKAVERHKEDLRKEIGFRKEMEEKWNEKKEEHKQQVSDLNKRTLCAEQDLQELKRTFQETYNEVMEQLMKLTSDRETVHERLVTLQKENDKFVGKHSKHSEQLQSETINLPNTIEELQERLLKLQEDLISSVIGKEAAEEKERMLNDNIMGLREQLSEKESLERDLMAQITSLQKQGQTCKKEMEQIASYKDKISTLIKNLNETKQFVKELKDHNNELKSRAASLQQELDNTETVQKDFVRLSQSLQIQLEKIRTSDTQVRWQHEDDVEECPTCRSGFSNTKRKQHCRHCGQIFCTPCLSHTILSGPKQRPAKVCDVCHTLLDKTSAPYFSMEAPHSPD